jgi:hypothetical protein
MFSERLPILFYFLMVASWIEKKKSRSFKVAYLDKEEPKLLLRNIDPDDGDTNFWDDGF